MSADAKIIAKVFNSNVLNDIANGDASFLSQVYDRFFDCDQAVSLSNLFESAYKILENDYRNEYFYKNLIVNKLFLDKHCLDTATIITEFRVGSNKADCVILNGKSTCYEIKTEYDSLVRLETQLDSYSRLFDEVYVVCSHKNQNTVVNKLPDNIGLIVLSEQNDLDTIKFAKKTDRPIDRKLIMQALRKPEYLEIAESISGVTIKLPNTLIFNECLNTLEQYKDDMVLNKIFIETLKKYRKNNAKLIQSLPKSLANAAISYKFSKKEIKALIENFQNKEILDVLSSTSG